MKRISFISIVFVIFFTGNAQQRPHYSQYVLNNYILNPAISGIENYTDLKITARDQWSGLNGAPKTTYISIHGPLGKKDYRTTATSYNIPGKNPRGKYYWENYKAAEPHHGIGFAAINDVAGPYNRFTAYGSYAYHIGINAKSNLSAGFSAGMTMVSINKNKTDFSGNDDPTDPATGASLNGEINKIKPELGVGLWLYSSDYYIGISGQQIIPQKISFADDATFLMKGKLIPHFFATAGYRFLLSEDINAIPSIMLKYIQGTPSTPQFDINLKLQYQDLLWLGGGYRFQDGYVAMLGLNVGNTFNVGYAYDYTNTRLNTYSKGTHEILIGFLLGNKYSEECPRCW